MQRIVLTEDHKAHIKAIALQTPFQEICGVITADKVIAMKNVSPHPESSFLFDLDEWEKVSDEAIAIYHTHTTRDVPGHLSPGDIENASLFGLPYVLYHVAFDCWDYYDPSHTHPYPLKALHPESALEHYLGWQFEWGRADCAALAKGFFSGFLGLPVKAFTRIDFRHLEGFKTFSDALRGAGFHDVTMDARENGLKFYDVPLMSLRSWDKGEHIGIVLELKPTRILHHVGGDRPSEIVPYADFWEKKTMRVFRHEGLVNR